MKKKKALLIWMSGMLLCAVFALTFHGSQTLAFMSAKGRLVNIGLPGSVSVEVVAQTEGLNQSNVGAANTGTSDCYVRMRVAMPNETVTGSGAENSLIYERNTEDWQDGGDGYYYYKKALAHGETTEPLYYYIEYREIPARASLDQLQVIAYAEAVQSAYLDDAGTGDAAWAAFEQISAR